MTFKIEFGTLRTYTMWRVAPDCVLEIDVACKGVRQVVENDRSIITLSDGLPRLKFFL